MTPGSAALLSADFHHGDASAEPQTLSDLIGSIYDAALDPTLWPAALRGCRHFVGGASCCLYSKTLRGIGAEHYFNDGGIDQDYRRTYFERYVPLDPTNAGHVFAELGQPVTLRDLFSAEEFAETRFYREWIRPQGFIDFVAAPIEKAGNWAMMISIFRSGADGPVDEEARERMRLLVPHVRRAALISRLIDSATSRVAGMESALDGLAAGVVLVDAAGRIVHANTSGAAMLTKGQAIVSRQGRLGAVSRDVATALDEAIVAAAAGDSAVGTHGVSIPIDTGEARFVAHVLPLPEGSRRTLYGERRAAVGVFVTEARLDAPGAAELIAKTFGLTLAELRVLIGITQVGGVGEAAISLGISEATVKTHLQRVFSKTGAARQADLVKLVAGYASPLLD